MHIITIEGRLVSELYGIRAKVIEFLIVVFFRYLIPNVHIFRFPCNAVIKLRPLAKQWYNFQILILNL